jgi:hypothetical protein
VLTERAQYVRVSAQRHYGEGVRYSAAALRRGGEVARAMASFALLTGCDATAGAGGGRRPGRRAVARSLAM